MELSSEEQREAWNLNDSLRTLTYGGFHLDKEGYGGHHAQMIAINNGWVDKTGYKWVVNEKGRDALRANGHPVAVFLPATDTWHDFEFEYCVFDATYEGKPAISIFKAVFGKAGSLGMDPILKVKDVKELHKFLGEWLDKTGKES